MKMPIAMNTFLLLDALYEYNKENNNWLRRFLYEVIIDCTRPNKQFRAYLESLHAD